MQKLIFSLFLSISFLPLSSTPTFAKVQYGEGEVIVAKNEVISDDLYIAGNTVRIEGRVEGDLYAAGEYIFLTGDITGDVTAIGNDLTIEGSIGQDAYLVGRTISLKRAKVSDSLHVAGQDITISTDTLLGGSLLGAGSSIRSDATVARSLMLAGASIYHNAPVLGETRLAGEDITLGPKTNINEDLTYFLSPENGVIDNQAQVKGSTNVVTEPAEWKQKRTIDEQNRRNFGYIWRAWSYVGMLLVGGIAIWLLKKPLDTAVSALHNQSLSALGTGLLISILTPPALLLLMFTVIGIPLALLTVPLYFILLYGGKIVISIALARTLFGAASFAKATPLFEMFVGVTLYHLLKLIPVGGYFVSLLATWIGVGAIYLSIKKSK